MKQITNFRDVPLFASEDEEAAFWTEHELGGEALEQMKPLPEGVLPPPRPSSSPLV